MMRAKTRSISCLWRWMVWDSPGEFEMFILHLVFNCLLIFFSFFYFCCQRFVFL
jgi:hypothetical protein